MEYHHLREEDRRQIGYFQSKGHSLRAIAKMLGVSPGTMSRELSRNETLGTYDPVAAQRKAKNRRRNSKRWGMKIHGDERLRNYVLEKLGKRWSPEQISGRIREIDRHIPSVSPEGIYRFCFGPYSRGMWIYLRRSRWGRRRKSRFPKQRKVPVPHRTGIEKRPRIVARKGRFGDFEADRVEGPRTSRFAIVAVRERKSGLYLLRRVGSRTSEENSRAIVRALSSVATIHTITYDNDPAFALHETVNEILDSDSFFTTPYHAWEKGGIENENGLLRQYVPKGCDIKPYSQDNLDEISWELNSRPRKRLTFRTPYEIANQYGLFKNERVEETKNTASLGVALGA